MSKQIQLNFNSSGVLTSTNIDQIRQGDANIALVAYFEGKNNANYVARYTFTRPDGKNVKGIMNASTTETNKFEKILDSAYYFAVDGSSTITVFLFSGDQVLAQGQATISIEKTDFSEETTITPDEYNELLQKIAEKLNIKDGIIVFESIGEIDSYNEYNANQYMFIKNGGSLFNSHTVLVQLNEQKTALDLIYDFSKQIASIEQSVTRTLISNIVSTTLKNNNGDIVAQTAFAIPPATPDLAGVMTASDKRALDSIPEELRILEQKLGAHKLTKNAEGDNFETEQELEEATDFYFRGELHEPDTNDYVIVEKYGNTGNEQPARFSFDGENWGFDYLLNNLTEEQSQALNSGITAEKVAKIDSAEEKADQALEDIGNLADLVNVIKLYVGTKELADGSEIPDLSVLRQIDPVQKDYSFREVYNAISNKKHVKIIATYPDSSRYIHDISNISENSITLTLDEGIVVDYFDYAGEFSEVVHKIGEGGGTGAVSKVNGKTGNVVLTADDIALESEDKTIEEKLIEQDETDEDLQEQVNNLKSRGRYLSNWNATTGLPVTDPSTELPYEYRQGDYFIVGTVGETNYKPTGTEYTGVASTVVETTELAVGDEYIYDGTQWVFQKNAPIDLSGYVNTDTTQTIDGQKTFTDPVIVNGINGGTSYGGRVALADNSWLVGSGKIEPTQNNARDIGSSTNKVKDAYIAGKLYGATASANTDDVINGTINVINASDIASTHVLTDEQFALITNGKPTVIIGNLLNNKDIFIFGVSMSPYGYYVGEVHYKEISGPPYSRVSQIKIDNKKIIFLTANAEIMSFSGADGIRRINVTGITFNNKAFPSYSKGYWSYDGTNLKWVDNSVVLDTTHTTYAGSLTSNKEYQFTQPLTSVSVASLEVQAGDNNPCWAITFTGTSGMTVSLPASVKWVNGTTPTFTSGKSYKVMVSKFGSDYLAVSGEF